MKSVEFNMRSLIVLLPIFFIGLSSAQALQSEPVALALAPAVALEQTQREPMSVVLLDEEVPLSAQDIVFTVSPRLNVGYKDSQGGAHQFIRNVEKIFNAKYSGYALKAVKSDNGVFKWDSVLQVFLARYSREVTASWRPSGETPTQPDFAYIDSRKVSSDIKYLLPATNLSEENNLVILGIRIRSGFDAGSYQYRKALLLLHVDPETGVKKTAVFTDPTSQAGETLKPALFILASKAQLPASNQDTLVTNVITAADTIQAVSQGEPPIADVPFHSFVSSTFRYVDGVSLEGSPSPYGAPVTSLTHDQDFEKFHNVLTKVLSYDAESIDSLLRTISLDDFQQLAQALRVGL